MGNILAKDVIDKIRWQVGDQQKIMHPDNELLEYLNEAQRAAVLIRPEVNPITVILSTRDEPVKGDEDGTETTLDQWNDVPILFKSGAGYLRPGTRQTIPADGYVFLSGIRNLAEVEILQSDDTSYSPKRYALVNKRACTPTDQENLDQVNPYWHADIDADDIESGSNNVAVVNYVFDNRNRAVFYNYPSIARPGTMVPNPDFDDSVPPADPTNPETVAAGHCYLEIVYAGTPPKAGNIDSDGNLTGAITLDDVYEPALVAYMMGKVCAKDPESAEDLQKSAAYHSMFAGLITGNADQKELELVVRHSPPEGSYGG